MHEVKAQSVETTNTQSENAFDGYWVNIDIMNTIERFGSYPRAALYYQSIDEITFSSIRIDGNKVYAFQPGGEDYNDGELKGDIFDMFVSGRNYSGRDVFRIEKKSADMISVTWRNKTNTFKRIDISEQEADNFLGEYYLHNYSYWGKSYLLFDSQNETEKEVRIDRDKIEGLEKYNYSVSLFDDMELLKLTEKKTGKERYFFIQHSDEFIQLRESDINKPYSPGEYIVTNMYLLIKQKPNGNFYDVDRDVIPEEVYVAIFLNRFKQKQFPVEEKTHIHDFGKTGEVLQPGTIANMINETGNLDPDEYSYNFALYSIPYSNEVASIVATILLDDKVMDTYLISCSKTNLEVFDVLRIGHDEIYENGATVLESFIEEDKITVYFYERYADEIYLYMEHIYTMDNYGYFSEAEIIRYDDYDHGDYDDYSSEDYDDYDGYYNEKTYTINFDCNCKSANRISCELLKLLCSGEEYELSQVINYVEAGADINEFSYSDESIFSPEGYKEGTALTFAAYYGNLETVTYLISMGADVNVESVDETPLIVATARGHKDIVKLLIKNGADINYLTETSQTPATIAYKYGFKELAVYLTGLTDFSDFSEGGFLSLVVQRNDYDFADLLLNKGINVNGRQNFHVPIIEAIEYGNWNMVDFLIKKGAEVNIVSHEESPMSLLMRYNNWERIEQFLSLGADINTFDRDGNSLLIRALEFNKNSFAKSLIEKGLDINIKNYNGKDALYYAIENDNFEMVKYLVDKGANYIQYAEGFTYWGAPVESDFDNREQFEIAIYIVEQAEIIPVQNYWSNDCSELHKSARSLEPEKVKLALKKIPADIRDSNGNTPLHTMCYAAHSYGGGGGPGEFAADILFDFKLITAENDIKKIINELIKAGADINSKNNDGKTPLHAAVECGMKPEIVSKFIHKGAEVNATDKYGKTPLFSAVLYSSTITELLISNGADINKETRLQNNAPLHYASESSYTCTKILLKHGAKVSTVNKQKQTPYDIAIKNNNSSIAVILKWNPYNKKQKYDDPNILIDNVAPLNSIIKEEDTGMMRLLIGLGADVNFSNSRNSPPLVTAIQYANDLNNIKYLVAKGANLYYLDNDSINLLYYAVIQFEKDIDLIKYLVENNVGSLDLALTEMLSAGRNHKSGQIFPITKYLIEKGADKNVKNSDGKSILEICVEKGKYNSDFKKVAYYLKFIGAQ